MCDFKHIGARRVSMIADDSLLTAELTLIPPWLCNHTHYKVWDEITYPLLNFNGATVEV